MHLEILANNFANISMPGKGMPNQAKNYEGYLSLVFSLGQLIGGLLVGLFLIKKLKKF
jgi:hypothetical protein